MYDSDLTTTTSPLTSSAPYSTGRWQAPTYELSFCCNSRSTGKTQQYYWLATDHNNNNKTKKQRQKGKRKTKGKDKQAQLRLWIQRFSSTTNNFALDTHFDTLGVIVYNKLSSCCPYIWKFFKEPPYALHIWNNSQHAYPICNICRNGIRARDDSWPYMAYFSLVCFTWGFSLETSKSTAT
jgi:hypothetical protein